MSSCEENVFGSRTWTRVNNMREALRFHAMVTINNRVFTIGGNDINDSHSHRMYELDTETGQWRSAWFLKSESGDPIGRSYHAVSVFPMEVLMPFCTDTGFIDTI